MNHSQPFSLIPEEQLLSSLSPLWKKRFRRAIDYLNSTLDRLPPPSWDEVAAHAAISPYHFHRMFRTVFKEPPGQYLRRLRLQAVLYDLVIYPDRSVTEIALSCGFSSSQSLAKALRRELDTSAKNIRLRFLQEGWDAIEHLLLQTGRKETGLEQSIARGIEFHIQYYPARALSVRHYPQTRDWEKVLEAGYESGSDVYGLFPVRDMEKPEKEQAYQIGRLADSEAELNLILPAATYLCCRVRLNSLVAYFTLWDAVYSRVLSMDIEPDPAGHVIEIFHYQDEWQEGIMDITICLTLKK